MSNKKAKGIVVDCKLYREDISMEVIRPAFLEIDEVWAFYESDEEGWLVVHTFSGLAMVIKYDFKELVDLKYNTYE